jgi:hypothetical protein
MTGEEIKNLKVGDTVYYVPMAHNVELRNPFLRTDTYRHSNYSNPLGVFKTTITEINKRSENEFSKNGYFFEGKIDTTPFEHLIPTRDGKEYYEKYKYCLHEIIFYNNPDYIDSASLEHTFMTNAEASEFYKKKSKAFKKNIKTYISHLRNEIEDAKYRIREAETRIENYKRWSD